MANVPTNYIFLSMMVQCIMILYLGMMITILLKKETLLSSRMDVLLALSFADNISQKSELKKPRLMGLSFYIPYRKPQQCCWGFSLFFIRSRFVVSEHLAGQVSGVCANFGFDFIGHFRMVS